MKQKKEHRNWGQRAVSMLALLLALLMLGSVLLSSLPVFGITQSEVDALKKEADAAKKEKDRLSKELAAAKKNAGKLEDQIKLLDQQMEAAEAEIEAQGKLIVELGKLVEEKQRELESSQVSLDKAYETSRQRIRFMAEYGSNSYLQILLAAENFYDFLSRLEIVRQVSVSDQKVLDRLRNAKDAVEQQKASLDASLREAESVKADMNSNVASLQSQRDQKDKDLTDWENKKDQINDDYADAIEKADQLMEEYQKAAAEYSAKNPYVEGGWMWPLPQKNNVITSKYGYRTHPVTKKWKLHTGIDLRASKGTNIFAAKAGTVVTSEYSSSWGHYVIISHGGGYTSLYAHMTKRNVKVGATVKQGQVIGTVGSTGWSTGAHLHYELRKNNASYDPMKEYPKFDVVYK
ncbi:MAG: peptidoglycan DD-metalloendopeptidase family protein [Clostridia bacterium]|jgi:murein DD-endopeptidase MepM/ murein hydrolase activator NlpD|nr:peptidoglycan DD-metalloendopeptidase family protein [Clostridia bacterium]